MRPVDAETQTPQSRFRWDDARILLALMRGGSLKAAGRLLQINPSTVGRRLDALEDGLGLRLFDRTPDGVLATAAAEQLFPFAEGLERAAADLALALDGFETEAEGVVRLTAPPGLAGELLVPQLGRLVQTYPRLQLEVMSTTGYADLARGEADIALRARRPTSGDLIATRLAEVGSAPIAAEAYAEQLGLVHDLDDVRWATWGQGLAHIDDATWVLEQVAPSSILLRTDRMETQLSAVRAGGCALVTAAPFGDLAGLTQLRLSPALKRRMRPLPRQQLWLVGHRALRDVPRVAAVWRWVQSCFGSAID
jgi:DNA-binding transcriptional LysR family regulator